MTNDEYNQGVELSGCFISTARDRLGGEPMTPSKAQIIMVACQILEHTLRSYFEKELGN